MLPALLSVALVGPPVLPDAPAVDAAPTGEEPVESSAADRVAAGTVLPGLHGDDSRTSDEVGFPTDSGQTDPPERSARPDQDRELDLDGSDENEADPTDDDREPGAS